jgi:hypothetical protein
MLPGVIGASTALLLAGAPFAVPAGKLGSSTVAAPARAGIEQNRIAMLARVTIAASVRVVRCGVDIHAGRVIWLSLTCQARAGIRSHACMSR